jgi:hypothetical protein
VRAMSILQGKSISKFILALPVLCSRREMGDIPQVENWSLNRDNC